MGLVLGKVYGLISKILSASWASNKKIQRSQHHLDEGLITSQNDSHVIIIPRQDYQDDEAQELLQISQTKSFSNEIGEKELFHAVTITNVVVTEENEVGLADVHISKDNESVVLPDHPIAKDDIIRKCQYNSASSSNAPHKVVRKKAKTIRHYSSLHKILLVGEGDFSFSASLAKAFGAATNIVATSLDDLDFLKKNYPRATTNIGYLRNSGGVVIHKVDATKLADHDLLYVSKFDRIIYNFPLAGFFNESKEKSLKRNRNLVRLFMMNAKELLDMGGEIHITHKTSSSPREWNLENVAKQCHLQLIEDVEFKLHHYPDYQTKYGFGGNENFNCYPSRTYKFGRGWKSNMILSSSRSCPTMAASSKFHSALAVTNVKSLIPITLDMETGQYHHWATLFKVQAKVHSVLEHIILPTDDKALKEYQASKEADLPLWRRLDAAVLQWIYATVSPDIHTSILVVDDSAENVWKRVADLFQDNKNSRAIYLENQFTNTNLADFSSTSAYCNRLKSLADQLSNVGAPVTEQRLVLRLLAGLTEAYSGFVTVMQQKDELPSFATAFSRLKFEETTIKERAARESGSAAALLTVDDDSSSQPQQQNNNNNGSHGRNNNKRGKKNNRGRGNNNHRDSRGCRGGGGAGKGGAQQQQQPQQQQPQFSPYQQLGPFFNPWVGYAQPPCPYPATSWQPKPIHQHQAGVLGSRPLQAYNASVAPSNVG